MLFALRAPLLPPISVDNTKEIQHSNEGYFHFTYSLTFENYATSEFQFRVFILLLVHVCQREGSGAKILFIS